MCFFVHCSPQTLRHTDTGQDRPWSRTIYMLLCSPVHKQCSIVKRPGGTPSFALDIKDSVPFVSAISIACLTSVTLCIEQKLMHTN